MYTYNSTLYHACKGGIEIFLKSNIVYLTKQSGTTLKKIQVNEVPSRTIEDLVYKDNPNPKMNTLIAIAKHFNIKIDDLLFTDLTKGSNE